MTVGGTDFALQQFHFHLPSEHLDNGTSRAMEMHMVWESAAGGIAVVSMFIDVDQGGEAAAAAPVEAAPAEAAPAEAASTAVGNATAAATAEAGSETAAGAAEKRWTGRLRRHVLGGKKEEKRHIKSRETVGAATPSTLLETVFSSVGAVSQPGSVTRTAPLVMSELLNTLNSGNFQS
jgi:hypothetical protein